MFKKLDKIIEKTQKQLKVIDAVGCIGCFLAIFFLFTAMSQVPQDPEVSFCCKQRITPYLANAIKRCESDVNQTSAQIGYTINCTRWVVFEATEDHDRIINQYGNVL